jgi:hypothetical protein
MYGFFQQNRHLARFAAGLLLGTATGTWVFTSTAIPDARQGIPIYMVAMLAFGREGSFGFALGFAAGYLLGYLSGARNILKPVAETGSQSPRPSF